MRSILGWVAVFSVAIFGSKEAPQLDGIKTLKTKHEKSDNLKYRKKRESHEAY